jgi:Phosphomannose isomerase
MLYPIKLAPVNKKAIWGGKRLGLYEDIAEAWLLTVRNDDMNVIDNGVYKGMTLGEYLGMSEANFPLLVKFIDAGDKLSIQVHPNKTEAWYIVEADEGAQLVYGLKENYTEAQIRDAIANGSIEDLLNYVNVKAGEVYFIPTGLVHAIGGGILIAEIQQNSNITYRFYDYNRKQADGTLRELHVEDAVKSIKYFENLKVDTTSCEYFTFNKYDITDSMTVSADNGFKHIVCIGGNGKIGNEIIKTGDSYFIPQGLTDVILTAKTDLSVIISIA